MSKNSESDKISNDNFSIFTKTKNIYKYNIYLTDYISDSCKFTEFLNLVNNATTDDLINIYINNGGGSLGTTIQIINTIKESKATIITHANGMVASAASLILLSGDKVRVHKNSFIMVHNYSSGVYGKGEEILANAKFNKKLYNKMFKDIYKDFLTKKELKNVIKGKDYWFTDKQTIKRLGQNYIKDDIE